MMGSTPMRAPDGHVRYVPNDKVRHALASGGKLVSLKPDGSYSLASEPSVDSGSPITAQGLKMLGRNGSMAALKRFGLFKPGE